MEVLVTSPWVPAEWIRAHGFTVRGAWHAPAAPASAVPEGVCAFAHAMSSLARTRPDACVVFTTACDQMRRAADAMAFELEDRGFLFLLPATWQTTAARTLYRAEVARLGEFLQRRGGHQPTDEELGAQVHWQDAVRARVRRVVETGDARQVLAALKALHEPALGPTFSLPMGAGVPATAWPGEVSTGRFTAIAHGHGAHGAALESRTANLHLDRLGTSTAALHQPKSAAGVPVALVGGPLPESQWGLVDAIESAGGRIVLLGTEPGERCLLPPFPRILPGQELPAVLADHYFDHAVDVFHRPNSRLYGWLAERLARRGARGIVLWTHVACDLWRVEAASLREAFHLPLLVLDAHDAPAGGLRDGQRLGAFIESLA